MLVSLTSTTPVATDLGYLLHKHPDRVRSVDVRFGRAHVFYPEATARRCTATTYVEVDPFGPARHRRERRAHGLEPYLNDRPYAASSMLSVGTLRRTDRRFVELSDGPSVREATDWWHSLTDDGNEGAVVKPAEPIVTAGRGLVLPGVKCRGREYLRLIYGPEYLDPANLERLRPRSLGRKSSLARREFALGIEALDRFVANEHLARVHECVFGVLALESEPIDPRL